MKNWKYIGWDSPEGLPCVIAFPAHAGQHKDMVPPNVMPLSAGFVSAVIIGARIIYHVSGDSNTLRLAARQEDSEAFNIQPK